MNWETRRKKRQQRKNATPTTPKWIWAVGAIWLGSPIIFGSFDGVGEIMSSVTAQSPNPTPTPTITAIPTPTINPNTPRLLKVSVEISNPNDLKVQQGDKIEVGQILADRQEERDRLVVEERELKATLDRLSTPIVPLVSPKSVPPTPDLPDRNFAEEEASITTASLKVKEIERKIGLQERKLDIIGQLQESAGQGDLPQGAIVHEQQKLAELQQQLEIAKGEEALAVAKLEKAKNNREYEEYKHKLAIARRIEEQNNATANFQRQQQQQQNEEREREIRKTELRTKLNELRLKIEATSAIRSNYAGTVRRIKFGQQRNNLLSVELLIAVDPSSPTRDPKPPAAEKPPNNTQTFSAPIIPNNPTTTTETPTIIPSINPKPTPTTIVEPD